MEAADDGSRPRTQRTQAQDCVVETSVSKLLKRFGLKFKEALKPWPGLLCMLRNLVQPRAQYRLGPAQSFPPGALALRTVQCVDLALSAMALGVEAKKIILDALPPSPALRVLTYNLWFSEHKGLEVVREKRMRAINAIIEDACPDVIFFQARSYEQLHCFQRTALILPTNRLRLPCTAQLYNFPSTACSFYARSLQLSCTAHSN